MRAATDRTKACHLQLEHDWLPIDCLFVGNLKQKELAEELCRRQATKLESLSSFPRQWSARTKGAKCHSYLKAREEQLIYAERLKAPTEVWSRVGR